MREPIQKRPRTHTLTIEVPICADAGSGVDADDLQEALNVVMSVSRIAWGGVVCDEIVAHLIEASP